MKVILKDDIANLGNMGSIVNVANGYARNYLLPRNLAVEASERNLKALRHESRNIEERIKKLKTTAGDLATRLSSVTITLTAKAGEEGKLFGSITSKDISEALVGVGFTVDKRKIHLDSPIKRIGEHVVKVRIHPEVSADLKVEVTAE
ncbi:MAG: 50S ribosomal protein L9 [Nitrospirae bacterium]|uniref:50S ribosomal protein L9 n=1 Tax=Candidatus Magnetobacterium casense TaxID=1455061 RepID=UPI00058D08A5|nr:50S ribosomal protein L9 [Candidatus Magnetobacterium casensis]MBF0336235.1 50S ribosomal protein L9 [Nitrospirota bacterium]